MAVLAGFCMTLTFLMFDFFTVTAYFPIITVNGTSGALNEIGSVLSMLLPEIFSSTRERKSYYSQYADWFLEL